MRPAYRIGLAIPLQGPGGIFGPSSEAVARLAVEALNAHDGVLGRRVALTVVDAGLEPGAAAERIAALLAEGSIEALVGWHISSVRQRIAPLVTGRIPYVYTSLYEGGTLPSGVFGIGETPTFQVLPALEWMHVQRGITSWSIVGADYIWPRRTAATVRAALRGGPIRIVHEAYVRYGARDFIDVLADIARSEAQGVVMLLVGQDAVEFNRQFSVQGFDRLITRFSPLMEENMLLASGAGSTDDLYVAAGYFGSLSTASALGLLGEYVQRFGPDAPVLNNAAESCYEGIMAVAELARHAGSTEVRDMLAVTNDRAVVYEGPRGDLAIGTPGARQRVYLAQARDYEFEVLDVLS